MTLFKILITHFNGRFSSLSTRFYGNYCVFNKEKIPLKKNNKNQNDTLFKCKVGIFFSFSF